MDQSVEPLSQGYLFLWSGLYLVLEGSDVAELSLGLNAHFGAALVIPAVETAKEGLATWV